MLQLGDDTLLETVMRNVVVLSRMKSHQKAQVMDLLGSKGVQHTADRKHRHIAVSITCVPPGSNLLWLTLCASEVVLAEVLPNQCLY